MKGKHIKLLEIPRFVVDEEAEGRLRQKSATWWDTYRSSNVFKKLWMKFIGTPTHSEDGADQRHKYGWFSVSRKENPDHTAILEGSYVVGDGWHVVAIRGDQWDDITLTLERDIESETPYR